jgi:hypothetical protein
MAETLDSTFPSKSFLNSAIQLGLLKAKIERTSKPSIQDSEFNALQILAMNIIELKPNLKPKLRLWWDLYHDVIDCLKGTDDPYNLQGIINTLTERIEVSDSFSISVSREIKKGASCGILAPSSLLLAHVIRVETIEYAIREQLNEAIAKFRLKEKYDPAEMCSVEHKIKKGNKWNSDVHALRDAIAHGRFKIIMAGNDWSIAFDNCEKGYNYHRTFTRIEFQQFSDTHSLLYEFQLSLCSILDLLILTASYFPK